MAEDAHHNIATVAVTLLELPVDILFSLPSGLEMGFVGIGRDSSAMVEAIAGQEGKGR